MTRTKKASKSETASTNSTTPTTTSKKSHLEYKSSIELSGFITDVKVCTQYNLLLFANYSNGTVMVYNLRTKEHMFDVSVGSYCYYVALDYTDIGQPPNNYTLPCIISTCDSYGDTGLRKHSLDTKQLIWKCDHTLSSSRGLYIDQKKRQVYVSERDSSKLKVCSTVDGSIITQFQVGNVTDVTMAYDTLIICEKDGGVKFLSPHDGSLIRNIGGGYGGGDGQFNYPRGVIVDPITRNVMVSDSDNHRIQIFSWQGQHLESVGEKGSGKLQFNTPFGIALDTLGGEFFISDCYNYRVIVFKYDPLLGKLENRFKSMLSRSCSEGLLSDVEFVFE